MSYRPINPAELSSELQERVQSYNALQMSLLKDARLQLVYELYTYHRFSLQQIAHLLGYSRSNICRWVSDARRLQHKPNKQSSPKNQLQEERSHAD